MSTWQTIAEHIGAVTGTPFQLRTQDNMGGGCINHAVRLESSDGRRYFVKLNDAHLEDMFAAEAEGLQEMAAANAVKVPRPVCHGTAGNQAYLVLEYLEMGGGGRDAGSRLGEQLAGLHRATRDRFGWSRDNTIGSTPQINTWHADWVSFWRDQRLGFQLDLAARHGHGGSLQREGERLREKTALFFSDYTPAPSLLHGDLWSGNYAVDRHNEPVIFDPAVYYGDREADLAMTELFGGFPAAFYQAYQATWALDAGYRVRKTFYNLYHILNHLNLFGSGYRGQAERMIGQLLSEVG